MVDRKHDFGKIDGTNIGSFLNKFSAHKPILRTCLSRLRTESPKTYEHTAKVVRICLPILPQYLDENLIDVSIYADTIHDLGKVAILSDINGPSEHIDKDTLERIRVLHMKNLKIVLNEIRGNISGDDNGLVDKAYPIAMAHHDILPADLINQTYYPRSFRTNRDNHQPMTNENKILMALILSIADKASRINVLKNGDHKWGEKLKKITQKDINPTVVNLNGLGKILTDKFLQDLAKKIWTIGENIKE